jgi:DNA polymerase-3 subunit epsilon
MLWLIVFLVILTIVFIALKSNSSKPDLSMLPKQFVVLDIETTGLDSSLDEIIEIGAIKVNSDSNEHPTFQTLVKPTRKIPREITQLTGITNAMVEKEGADIKTEIAQLIDFIGDLDLVAYNAPFDMGFLRNAAYKHNLEIRNKSHCALVAARKAWPSLKSYKLTELAKLNGRPVEGHHRALQDAEFTIIVYTAAASTLGASNWARLQEGPVSKSYPEKIVKTEGDPSGPLKGEIIVFTADFELCTIKLAGSIAANLGCDLHPNVTKKTTILVVGNKVSYRTVKSGNTKTGKHIKALENIAKGQAIRILSESEFRDLVWKHRQH